MSKNYKPIWIACPKELKSAILNRFTMTCPHASGFEDELKKYGDVSCKSGKGCHNHWLEFIDFDCGEEEGGEEEGDGE